MHTIYVKKKKKRETSELNEKNSVLTNFILS